jgi:hypothetical protein
MDGGGWEWVEKKLTQLQTAPPVNDTLLAQELNELSFNEREKVLEDVHGVADIINETPEFVSKCLDQFRDELSKVSRQRRKTLDRAIFLKPSLEHDTKFKLLFLRADRYDAAKSAKRMCEYYDHKLAIFGEEKLAKRITLEDMDEDDMVAVKTGAVQGLPQKDQSGRPIWLSTMNQFKYGSWENQVRRWRSSRQGIDVLQLNRRCVCRLKDSVCMVPNHDLIGG